MTTMPSELREVLWALAQGVREAIREDSGPREESIALSFNVEKLIGKAEAEIAKGSPESAAVLAAAEAYEKQHGKYYDYARANGERQSKDHVIEAVRAYRAAKGET
jgi:hypothetical protein